MPFPFSKAKSIPVPNLTVRLTFTHLLIFVVVFRIYDVDNDGYISNGELFLIIKMLTSGKLSDENLQQVVDKTIRDLDRDKDGKISQEEFREMLLEKHTGLVNSWAINF